MTLVTVLGVIFMSVRTVPVDTRRYSNFTPQNYHYKQHPEYALFPSLCQKAHYAYRLCDTGDGSRCHIYDI